MPPGARRELPIPGGRAIIRREEPERARRIETIWAFARHFCGVMRQLDPQHPLTVGVSGATPLEVIGPDVDVLSFHDYSPNRAAIRAHFQRALSLACSLQKPLFVSEIGCLARANPYDVTLEICHELGLGWYLWELMIGRSRWNDIHGIVYPDGTGHSRFGRGTEIPLGTENSMIQYQKAKITKNLTVITN